MERRQRRRQGKDTRRIYADIVSTGILVFGLLAIGIPLINHSVSAQVLTVANGGEMTCGTAPQGENINYKPADALAILGAGMRLTDYGAWVDNKYEDERLNAGAGLIVAGFVKPDADIVILDGVLPDGANKKLSENYLKQRVGELSNNVYSIDKQDVIVDHDSVNTPTGMDVLKQLAEDHHWEHILIVTHANHVQRAELDAYLRDLCNISFMSVEDYAKLFNPTLSAELETRNETPQGKMRELREEVAFLLHMYDPEWKIRTMYKSTKKQ